MKKKNVDKTTKWWPTTKKIKSQEKFSWKKKL